LTFNLNCGLHIVSVRKLSERIFRWNRFSVFRTPLNVSTLPCRRLWGRLTATDCRGSPARHESHVSTSLETPLGLAVRWSQGSHSVQHTCVFSYNNKLVSWPYSILLSDGLLAYPLKRWGIHYHCQVCLTSISIFSIYYQQLPLHQSINQNKFA